MKTEESLLKPSSIIFAATLALAAAALPAYAQHAMTPEQKAEAEARRAEAAAAQEAAPAAETETATETDERTIWDGVYTTTQAEAGKAIYTLSCQTCHGPTGRGGPGGPALTGAAFTKKWSNATLLDFVTFAHTQMPPGNGGGAGTGQDYVNIITHLLDLHGADPGEVELAYDEGVLGNIMIGPKPR